MFIAPDYFPSLFACRRASAIPDERDATIIFRRAVCRATSRATLLMPMLCQSFISLVSERERSRLPSEFEAAEFR